MCVRVCVHLMLVPVGSQCSFRGWDFPAKKRSAPQCGSRPSPLRFCRRVRAQGVARGQSALEDCRSAITPASQTDPEPRGAFRTCPPRRSRGPLACSPPPPRVPAPPRFPAPDGARAGQTARSGRQSSGRPGGRCSAPSESVRPRVLLPPPPPRSTRCPCVVRVALCMCMSYVCGLICHTLSLYL